MSCTFADLQVIRYAEAMVSTSFGLAPGTLTDAQLVRMEDIKALLVEIGPVSVDHEIDCVEVALLEAKARMVP